jgi:DNA-binding HxlR family transcriptional regulator
MFQPMEQGEAKVNERKNKRKQTKRSTITAKKTKIEGNRTYIDQETGELVDCNVVRIEDADANFDKIWLGHILDAIDEIGNAKMKVLMFLISKRERSNNAVIMTTRELAKEIGISLDTVSRTLQALEKHGIINRKTGAVFLNPNVVFRGRHKHRMNVLIKYHHYSEQSDMFENKE